MRSIRVFIPGKVMLAGEYAVLRGGHSLAATLTCGMTISVEWDPHAAKWEIHSNLWTEPKFVEDDHSPQREMLCRAIQFAAKRTGMHGGKITVSSDIEIEHGIGSSSALRLGICAAFFTLNSPLASQSKNIPREAIEAAWQLQSEGQGIASGYDIVSQYTGGLVEFSYEYENNKWKPHWFRHNLAAASEIVHIFVGGSGAPTTQTLQTMASWLDGGNRAERLMDTSEWLVDAFNEAIQWPSTANLKRLITATSLSRGLFTGNPHFPNIVAAALAEVPGLDQTWSWKTTGAGGEDAILLIGGALETKEAAKRLWKEGWHRLDHSFSMAGARILDVRTFEQKNEKAQTAGSTVVSGARTQNTKEPSV